MTDIPLPDPGDTTWTDWATEQEDLSDAVRNNGAINVKNAPYNAAGDGVTDDRAAIQAAIDAANASYVATGSRRTVLIDAGVYAVGSVNYTTDGGASLGAMSLLMRNGVDIRGTGTVKVKNSAYGAGAFYRVFASRDVTRLSNASINGITVDGNRANQTASTQCSNIVLECSSDVTVSGIRSINANGNGIMLRGVPTAYATDLKVINCTVTNATYIGIQSSQFDGLVISGNYVADTTDNCIDVYGDDGTTVTHGRNFTISGNTVRRGLVGIFPETVRDGVVTGNTIESCTSGVLVNRINGEPRNITISGNAIRDCARGVTVSGDTGGVFITGNTIDNFTAGGVRLGYTGGNCSRVVITGNYLTPASSSVYLIEVDGAQSSLNRATNNFSSLTDVAHEVLHGATLEVGNVFEPFQAVTSNTRDLAVAKKDINLASGGTETITLPGQGAGTLTIFGTSGGAWDSVWHGAFVSGNSRVDVTTLGSAFTTPGNVVASVAGSTTTRNITITTVATGSGVSLRWSYRFL